jgi:hypothetical protein
MAVNSDEQMRADVQTQTALLSEFKAQCGEHRRAMNAQLGRLVDSVDELRAEIIRLRSEATARSVVTRVWGNVAIAAIGCFGAIIGALVSRHAH